MFLKLLRTSVTMIAMFTILTGLLYPYLITGLAQVLFPGKANGSMIVQNGKAAGSELVGQPFSDPKYFWGRLSATSPYAYNAAASTGSNFGPLNPAFLDAVNKRVHDLRAADSLNTGPIPVDLVTASGSGLDPHIGVAAALYQLPRVARERHMTAADVRALVDRNTEGRTFGILGEPRVNVLKLNLALDEAQNPKGGK